MEVVRAAPDRHHDDAAGVPPVLRGVVGGLDLHFLHGVQGGDDRLRLAVLQAHDGRVVVYAVNQVVVLQRRLAVDAQAVAERRCAEGAAVAAADLGSYPGAQQAERLVAAPVEREFLQLLALDGVVERGVLRLEDGRRAFDRDDLDEVAHFKLEIEAQAVAAVDLHAGTNRFLEALGLDGDLVGSDLERPDDIDAALVRRSERRNVRVRLAGRDVGAWNHGASRVGDRSGDRPLVLLAQDRQAGQGQADRQHASNPHRFFLSEGPRT